MKYKKCALFSGAMVFLVILTSHENYDFSIEGQFRDYAFSLVIAYFIFLFFSVIFASIVSSLRAKKTDSLKTQGVTVVEEQEPEPEKEQTSEPETTQKIEPPAELMPDIQKLLDATTQWSQHVKPLKCSTTPETFFDAYDSLIDYANEVYHASESYKKYSGDSAIAPDCEKNICELIKGECLPDELNSLIERSAEETITHMHSLGNDWAQKRKSAQEWHDSFEPYLSRMPEEAIEHLHTKYGMMLMDIERGGAENP